MKTKVLTLVFIFALAAGSAFGTTFNFTFAGSNISATGTLAGDELGGGIFMITSGHINITGDITASGDLIATPDPGNPGIYTSPAGYYFYDNELFTGVDPQLDLYGLLFAVPYEVNIYENPPTCLSFVNANGYQFYQGKFEAVSTPEPSSLALLGSALLGCVAILRRRFAA